MEEIIKFLKSQKPLIDATIKKYMPQKIDAGYLEWALGKARHEYDIDSLSRALVEPVWDFLSRGGKRWRPALFLLIMEALGGDLKKVSDFAIIPELAHNGSIMVDDIEDSGELRRGRPCTHKLFGVDVAINAGNFMYFFPLLVFIKAREKIDEGTLLRAYEVYAQEMINIHAGQALDIWWHKGKINDITESQYLQMCALKTGTLARMAARLAVALCGGSKEQDEKIGELAETIGITFQIQDDILSASGKEFAKKKGLGDDITEGKRSLLVIHTLKRATKADRERLLSILNAHTRDPRLIKEALDLLHKYNSISYARETAKRLITQAWDKVAPLLAKSPSKKKLRAFVDFLIQRDI